MINTDMITFNPGPSQLSPEIIKTIQEIASSGFLSTSHRSITFSQVSEEAIEGMRVKMSIPADYRIFYQPSATAAMDTLLRNVVKKRSFHFVHGAFSNLFYQTAVEMGLHASLLDSALNTAVPWEQVDIPDDIELVAVTHNETSTGLMWPQSHLQQLRMKYPTPLLAIDVTSSFGAVSMKWREADIWFASVQKCLGLPSGLGFLIVGPRAFEKSKELKGVAAWQSFEYLNKKLELYQTPETPNMFVIALLAKQMSLWNLEENEHLMWQKAHLLYHTEMEWEPFILSKEWRSPTLACFVVNHMEALMSHTKKAGIVLGEGYGPLKETTIRIANFPAIKIEHIQNLLSELKKFEKIKL